MLFNSQDFLFFFLPLTLAGFYLCRHLNLARWAMAWLVIASLFFYGWWNPVYLGLLVGSILLNYLLGNWIQLYLAGNKLHVARLVLTTGLIANLSLLGYFKYADFFIANLNRFAGSGFDSLNLILPLAISFFTFQQISYLVDTYQKKVAAHDFLEYCLFVTFFPQLIAGPIVHHSEMMPQFRHRNFLAFGSNSLAKGISIFNLGLFKKVILADEFATYANPVFDGAAQGLAPDFVSAWIAALAYTLQLYFDFSGYSDMAIGLALMFGIVLPVNFFSPYKAPNIIEFWRRWHMTLSRFLRDYIYIPLGGNRKGEGKRMLFLMITMLLGGLWHGAGWTFVAWGALHGLYLVVNHGWHQLGPTWTRDIPLFRLGSHVLTFIAIVVAWVLFRATDIESAGIVLQSMTQIETFALADQSKTLLTLMAGLGLVWFAPNTIEFFSVPHGVIDKTPRWQWQANQRTAVVFALLAFVAILNLSRAQEFLYFQF